MKDTNTIIAKKAVIKLVGIFESSGKDLVEKFCTGGYVSEEIKSNDRGIFTNLFYPEFRNLFFFCGNSTQSSILIKAQETKIVFLKNKKTSVPAHIGKVEVFLFENGLHFFSIEIHEKDIPLSHLSDIQFCARNFGSTILTGESEQRWVEWIEKNCLCGINVSSKEGERIPVDEYSGSKFKLFSIIDIPEKDEQISEQTRDNLLYDFGCASPLGSAAGESEFSPSHQYLQTVMKDKLEVFRNYSILVLFDTFTVVGEGVIDELPKQSTWTQTYFRVYLYNLFIKYNLFRYNIQLRDDSVAVRDAFEDFLNTYNYSHISYNFLPNLIYHTHRNSLQIDDELEKFQVRINRISQAIQEEQQKRSNLLLGIVGAMTSISGIGPVYDYAEGLRSKLSMSLPEFYGIAAVGLLLLALPLVAYVFPGKVKKIIQKLQRPAKRKSQN
jgi:hypothetical protein